MKKIIKSTVLFLSIIIPILMLNSALVYAQESGGETDFKKPVLEDLLQDAAGKTGLPGYDTLQHGEAAVDEGAAEITSAIYFVVDFVKYLLASIAVLMLVVSGVRLVVGGEEEEMIKNKNGIMYSIAGLIIVILADVIVKKVFFGEYGEAFETVSDAKLFAEEGAAQIKGIYNFVEIFVASIAVLSIIYSGIRILASGGEEEVITKHKTHIFYAIGGLVLIGLAEFAVKEVIFPKQGESIPRADQAKLLIKNITNMLAALIGMIAVLMYIYGGYLYVIAGTEEENINKAKKVLINATVGILIAGGSYGIVNTLIRLEGPIEVNAAEEQMPAKTNLPTELQ